MSQSPSFVDPHYSDYVCKLNTSLYGLKQTPRVWNEKSKFFFPFLGFGTTYADFSLFVKQVGVGILLLYGMIKTSMAMCQLINKVIYALTKEFEIKYLGQSHYMLVFRLFNNQMTY